MLTRRMLLAGLLATVSAEVADAANRRHGQAAPAKHHSTSHKHHGAEHPHSARLDAVIDISHMTTVSNFHLARKKSNIMGVIHKASEGGDWRDPLYTKRRAEAEKAGLLWGAYHFGTHQYSGADQAAMFLSEAKPGPMTLMALDFEANDLNPSNTMRLKQAEDFVKTVLARTGRLPLIYTNAAWADGEPASGVRYNLGDGITEHSILARCPLWLADYRLSPRIPTAWKGRGWQFWQYAGTAESGGPRSGRTGRVWGVDSCDRNLFPGDAVALRRFWKGETRAYGA